MMMMTLLRMIQPVIEDHYQATQNMTILLVNSEVLWKVVCNRGERDIKQLDEVRRASK